ncbi:MAG: hypothetical protein Q9167_005561 [Letrouitia subvulpina]
MSSANFDALVQDVSNQMSRSQLFRRLSGHSHSASPNGRKTFNRVGKGSINGTSQFGVQRRRTTAANTSRTTHNHRGSQDCVPSLPESNKKSLQTLGKSQYAARPMTWHPGIWPSENMSDGLAYMASLENNGASAIKSTIPNQDVSTLWDPLSLGQGQDPGHGYQSFMTYEQPHPTLANVDAAYLANSFIQGPETSWDTSADYLPNPNPQDYREHLHPYENSPSLDCSQVLPDVLSYSTPQMSNITNTQYFRSTFQNVHPLKAEITKQKSRELVGMGLYDGPDRDSLSKVSSSPEQLGLLFIEPPGKGLKLEETWEPPKNIQEDTEEDDDEGYATTEADDDLTTASETTEGQVTYIPSYTEFSNQSFFLDCNDTYTNCMAFAQGAEVCQPNGAGGANAMKQTFAFF